MNKLILFIVLLFFCVNVKAQIDNVVIDGVTFSADRKILIEYPREKTNTEYVIPEGTEIIKSEGFVGSSFLQQITIPTSLKEIGDCAFYSCEKLTTVVWGTYPQKVGVDIFGFDYFGTPIEQFYISENNKDCTLIDGILFSADRKTLLRAPRHGSIFKDADYTIPEGTEVIAKYAFEGASVYYVVLPSSLKLIEDRAFWVEERIPVRNSYSRSGSYRRINSLTCLAAIPPVLTGDPFYGLYGIGLTVPEEYFDVYVQSPVWSYFMYINGKFVSVFENSLKKTEVVIEGETISVISEKDIVKICVFNSYGTLLLEKKLLTNSLSFGVDKLLKGIILIELHYKDGTKEVFKLLNE